MSLFKNMFSTSEEENKESKIAWKLLTDLVQLDQIDEESSIQPVIIFKHSTRCSVSRMALHHFENDFDTEGAIIPYFLDLLEHRDISNEIASRYSVVHQSPQLLLISKGKSIYDVSHNFIDAKDLRNHI